MRIGAQITQDVLGSTEWAFTVDDPVFAVSLPNQFGKYLWVSKRLHIAMKAQLASVEGCLERISELTPEYFFQCGHGQQEPGVRRDPFPVVGGQASGRNDAMDVRMVLQFSDSRCGAR